LACSSFALLELVASEFGFDRYKPRADSNLLMASAAIEMVCFSAGIKVSLAERDSVAYVVVPIRENVGLVNDYYRFYKEYAQ
jgi:hypothetical protein